MSKFAFLLALAFFLAPLCAPQPAHADDTIEIYDPPQNDTVGGRRARVRFKLSFTTATFCTTIIEYDSYATGGYDSMTFYTDAGGAQNRGPLDGNGDSTPRWDCASPGSTYNIRWNVRADVPDTIVPNARIRIRILNAGLGTVLGETLFTPIGIRTILSERPETADAKSDQTDTVRITWYQDTYAKYYVVWRDTGYPPNDTARFVNVSLAVTGQDSRPDNFYYNAGLGRFSLIDTHVGKPPGERSPRLDSYWVWYVTAIDTWDNQHEFLSGYTDSIGAEFIFVRKRADSVSTRHERPGETIPGATLRYTLTVSNTEGYTPAHRVRIFEFIPTNTEYRGTGWTYNVELDTRHQYITQTDTPGDDHVQFVPLYAGPDSNYIQIDTPLQPFNTGDTARIRFRVIIR